jgi:uncharacterized protein DUF6624
MPSNMDEKVRQELLAMRAEDQRVREQLAEVGLLFQGYHPRMEQVHLQNAGRLKQIIAEHGWPGKSLVGDDGTEAAWLILQHAISDPPFQRHSLELLRAAEQCGEIPFWFIACLEDRIRIFEGCPQLYGTHFDWNEQGEMTPLPIEDPDHVEERRQRAWNHFLSESVGYVRSHANYMTSRRRTMLLDSTTTNPG